MRIPQARPTTPGDTEIGPPALPSSREGFSTTGTTASMAPWAPARSRQSTPRRTALTPYANGGRMGPYNVTGSDGSLNQTNLVMEYSLTSAQWVGAQLPISPGSDVDLSGARAITIRVRGSTSPGVSTYIFKPEASLRTSTAAESLRRKSPQPIQASPLSTRLIRDNFKGRRRAAAPRQREAGHRRQEREHNPRP